MATHELYAYLCVRDAGAAMDFYIRAFGARELFRLAEPGGRVGHAELDFDGHVLMLSEEYPEMGVRSPESLGGTPVTLHLQVEDVDSLWNRAVGAGATVTMPLADQFWGDRYGQLVDPFGHKWSLAQHKRTPSPEEIQEASKAVFK